MGHMRNFELFLGDLVKNPLGKFSLFIFVLIRVFRKVNALDVDFDTDFDARCEF